MYDKDWVPPVVYTRFEDGKVLFEARDGEDFIQFGFAVPIDTNLFNKYAEMCHVAMHDTLELRHVERLKARANG